jgi:hypothetical protein
MFALGFMLQHRLRLGSGAISGDFDGSGPRFPSKRCLPCEFSDLGTVRPCMCCGLVVTVPGYRSRGPVSIPGATRSSEK